MLELILIMIILCTVLAMATPSLRGFFSSRQLDHITENVLTMARYAKVQSVFEALPHRVNFDPYKRLYWVSSKQSSQFERLGNNFGNMYPIPSEVKMSFQDVNYENGLYYFEFDSNGNSKQCSVRFEDEQNNVKEVICYSLSEDYEIVEIVNGKRRYKEEREND